MDLNKIGPTPILNHDDDSTTYTGTTPPESVVTDVPDHHLHGSAKPNPFLVPWPGSTYIIRSVSSGHVITLLEGQILLTQPGGHGSIHWVCVETKGWLGFRNTVSGKYLGHDENGRLCCRHDRHQLWEFFCNRPRPKGDCVLLMEHGDGLLQIGITVEEDEQKLVKYEKGDGEGWEFLKV